MEQTIGRGKSILVVEDEPGIAKMCVRILTAEGFQVDVAENGQVALDMWRRKDYDLCISDVRTPQMNGIEFYKKTTEERPETANRFIFSTGDVLSSNIKTFLEETKRLYLPKPFAPENLRAIVKTVLVAI